MLANSGGRRGQISFVAVATRRIALTNDPPAPRYVVFGDHRGEGGREGGVRCPPIKKKGGAVGRDRGSTVQIRAHSDSYLHAFRLCEHLHVQKKKKWEWRGGQGGVVGGRRGPMWRQCAEGGREQRRQRFIRVAPARVCATCVSRPRYLVRGGPTGIGREKKKGGAHVAAVLRHGSKFVSDYRTRPGIQAEQAVDPV